MTEEEQLYQIADLMLSEFSRGFSRTYMFCIAREGAKGVAEAGLTHGSSEQEVYAASKKSISRYFTGWSDDLNRDLATSFSRHYGTVCEN